MPDHGSETAASPCCRPSSPSYKPNPRAAAPAARGRPGFWTDWAVWKTAARNTRNCLIGCMIGDLGVIIYMQAYHPHVSMWLTMSLAMVAGLITSILFEGAILRFKERFAWPAAFRMAFSMSFLSMLGMELAANATDLILTGGRVPVHHPFYWQALALSVLAGFLAPLPYNYYKFKKHGVACH
jgi:hypothetical protein